MFTKIVKIVLLICSIRTFSKPKVKAQSLSKKLIVDILFFFNECDNAFHPSVVV